MYDPIQFTHQNASWIPAFVGQFCTYPDETRIVAHNEQWKWFTDTNPLASTGTVGWTTLDGNPYTVNNPDYRIGRPVIQASGIGVTGKVWIDDITIDEYDGSGNFITTLWNTQVDSIDGWGFWSKNGSGSGSFDASESGASASKCLVIAGTTDDANLGNDTHRFIVTQGHQYKITGRLKGQNVASSATVRFRVDFYSCEGDIMA
jgi:endoglucanase